MKILITGPESSGKTTLAQATAEVIAGSIVREEVARPYLTKHGAEYDAEDLVEIWKRQLQLEKSLEEQYEVVICDTAHLVMAVWNEYTFKDDRLMLDQLEKDLPFTYDLVLICAPDLPWTPDPLREAPGQVERQIIFDRYKEILEAKNQHFYTATGGYRSKRWSKILGGIIQEMRNGSSSDL